MLTTLLYRKSAADQDNNQQSQDCIQPAADGLWSAADGLQPADGLQHATAGSSSAAATAERCQYEFQFLLVNFHSYGTSYCLWVVCWERV